MCQELNELYNCLDLYIVSSRYEGGPQAILECAASKTPILSTKVGVAPEVLHPESIYEIGRFTEMNELILIGHGMNSPVSGWIAVLMTV